MSKLYYFTFMPCWAPWLFQNICKSFLFRKVNDILWWVLRRYIYFLGRSIFNFEIFGLCHKWWISLFQCTFAWSCLLIRFIICILLHIFSDFKVFLLLPNIIESFVDMRFAQVLVNPRLLILNVLSEQFSVLVFWQTCFWGMLTPLNEGLTHHWSSEYFWIKWEILTTTEICCWFGPAFYLHRRAY